MEAETCLYCKVCTVPSCNFVLHRASGNICVTNREEQKVCRIL